MTCHRVDPGYSLAGGHIRRPGRSQGLSDVRQLLGRIRCLHERRPGTHHRLSPFVLPFLPFRSRIAVARAARPSSQAIYPTVIIVLVSLNRSHVERGFLETVQDRLHLPPLRRPVTEEIDVTVTTRCETQPPRLSQIVLDVDEKDLVPKEGAGDSSTHTVEERKPEDIV